MKRFIMMVAGAFLLSSGGAYASDNIGFEDGNLAGWGSSGGVFVTTNHSGYTAPDGQYFALVQAACPTSQIYRSVTLVEGQTISGWAAFDAQDYLPFNDSARLAVEVYGQSWQLFYSNISQVGNYGNGPWIVWSFEAPAAGDYNLVFSVSNSGDCALSSYGLFDVEGITCDDSDEDGFCDDVDNCPGLYNADQVNSDGDEYGDACDECPFDADNDIDEDAICGDVDNCAYDSNADQLDNDEDGAGDVCDDDDDDDGVYDEEDNCQFDFNPDQADAEGDGIGDVCDEDDDNDGLSDADDECAGTALDALVDEVGCSIDQYCPCDAGWKNHGGYVSCVAKATNQFVEDGLITGEEKGEIVSEAAQTACGAKVK
jgi:hypothetical protein